MNAVAPASRPRAVNIKSVWTRLRALLSRTQELPRTNTIDAATALLGDGRFTKAMALLRPAAAAGTPAAQRLLGLMYLNGQGVLPNPAEAVEWLKRAADAGDGAAQHQLALIYALGQPGLEERSTFGKWYTAMIEGGGALSSVDAADLFPTGMTVAQDYAAAAEWARKSASQGHADAQANLGIFLLRGLGLPQDRAAALDWFEKAAAQGNPRAKAYLGIHAAAPDDAAPDWPKAIALLKAAAEGDDILAQLVLGRWYVGGAGDTPPDIPHGVFLVAAAAAKGMAEAQYQMGVYAHAGVGMKPDGSLAATWWRRAADRGHGLAMLALGKLYASGSFGAPNHLEAARQFERAALSGLYEGQLIYGRHLLVGAGVAQSVDGAAAWFQKAAAQQNTAEVRFELGRLAVLRAGDGSVPAEAQDQLWSAANDGNAAAATLLARLAAQARLPGATIASALALLEKAAWAGHEPAVTFRADLVLSGDHDISAAEAQLYLEAAAEAGYLPAQMRLAAVFAKGEAGFPQDEQRALHWMERAAHGGTPAALRGYGWMLVTGAGCAPDIARGVEYLRRAADLGDSGAMYAIGRVAYEGWAGEADHALAAYWLNAAADRGNTAARTALNRLRASQETPQETHEKP